MLYGCLPPEIMSYIIESDDLNLSPMEIVNQKIGYIKIDLMGR